MHRREYLCMFWLVVNCLLLFQSWNAMLCADGSDGCDGSIL